MGKSKVKESIREILEAGFRDACEFEFTVQEGKLWVINCRPLRRSPRANLKIVTDFFLEQKITEADVLERISINDLIEYIKPIILNPEELIKVGKGIPASGGAASGRIMFLPDESFFETDQECIICCEDVNHGDIDAIRCSKGILALRGGMTSHAALVSRAMGKPCVVGIRDIKLDHKKRSATINENTILEREWITIDGTTGILYKGRGQINYPDWKTDSTLAALQRIIEKLIQTNSLISLHYGKAWLIRDLFLHCIPLLRKKTLKKNVPQKDYISFRHPDETELSSIRTLLSRLEADQSRNLSDIIHGLRNTLIRLLSQKAGIGSHYKYYHPLLDPIRCVKKIEAGNEIIFRQLIAEEFFNIGRNIPHLIDIYRIRIYFEIETWDESGLWFLDYTNLKGESLVQNSGNIVSYYIEINDEPIEHNFFVNLYNVFRKREYFWKWYSENNTTHKEMIEYLKHFKEKPDEDSLMNYLAHDLELLVDNKLTRSGEALI